jgi:hypothetical protein
VTAPNVSTDTLAAARAALKEVEPTATSLEMYSTESEAPADLATIGARRRRLRAGDPDPISTVSLVLNDAGVLVWREGGPNEVAPQRRLRRGVGAPTVEGDLVELYQFEKLEPNEINRFLTDLDTTLNATPGLTALSLNTPKAGPATVTRAPVTPSGKKRRLLLVHGTFSKTDAFLNGFEHAPNGNAFLKRIFGHYDEILAFDHPTLSVSPVLNSFDLAAAMTSASGPLDVVAHSRGGLVARWFLEGFAGTDGSGPNRAVLVGSPLGGTSLASPARLRDSLSMLSNIGTAMKMGGAAAIAYFPLLAAPLALLKIATSIVSAAAKTPIIDAAVQLIPGLSGQSRVALNHEIERLRRCTPAKPPTYFAVKSNFETAKPGWKFWEWFRADKLKDLGADIVFPGENDLVVDTGSMIELGGPPAPVAIPKARWCDFEKSDKVYHTNYFEQPETLDFVLDSFKVP